MVTTSSRLPEGDSADAAIVAHWLGMLPAEFDDQDRLMLRKAGDIALMANPDKRILSGETQLRHALSVAEILTELRMDRETVAAALLLGVMQDSSLSIETLRRELGESTAHMVDDLARIDLLTDLSSDVAGQDEGQHAENLRRLLLGIAEDIRVILVVVAEQLHLMRSARRLSPETESSIGPGDRGDLCPIGKSTGNLAGQVGTRRPVAAFSPSRGV